MHNHDTNETFIAITGTWRCSWKFQDGNVDHVDTDIVASPRHRAWSLKNLRSLKKTTRRSLLAGAASTTDVKRASNNVSVAQRIAA
jgi:hypothetical protein